mmetsp:Transcript_37593/g.111552  ORF Transcript_37593/g.111552 Transcript_37593/m.111552 type:complete len:333 (+) Transcript_37593:1485-2483(+)
MANSAAESASEAAECELRHRAGGAAQAQLRRRRGVGLRSGSRRERQGWHARRHCTHRRRLLLARLHSLRRPLLGFRLRLLLAAGLPLLLDGLPHGLAEALEALRARGLGGRDSPAPVAPSGQGLRLRAAAKHRHQQLVAAAGRAGGRDGRCGVYPGVRPLAAGWERGRALHQLREALRLEEPLEQLLLQQEGLGEGSSLRSGVGHDAVPHVEGEADVVPPELAFHAAGLCGISRCRLTLRDGEAARGACPSGLRRQGAQRRHDVARRRGCAVLAAIGALGVDVEDEVARVLAELQVGQSAIPAERHRRVSDGGALALEPPCAHVVLDARRQR